METKGRQADKLIYLLTVLTLQYCMNSVLPQWIFKPEYDSLIAEITKLTCKTSSWKVQKFIYSHSFLASATLLQKVMLNLPGEGQDHTKKINHGVAMWTCLKVKDLKDMQIL